MTLFDVARSPKRYARIAALFYLGTIVFGTVSAMSSRVGVPANLIATACYVAVTIIFYGLFRPVSKGVSITALVFGLAGCALGALRALGLSPVDLNPLAIFGVYCLLIGYLTFRSGFIPPLFGVLMAIGGLGWLTFAVPALGSKLAPFNMLPGVIGETALTLRLLIAGVDETKWRR